VHYLPLLIFEHYQQKQLFFIFSFPHHIKQYLYIKPFNGGHPTFGFLASELEGIGFPAQLTFF